MAAFIGDGGEDGFRYPRDWPRQVGHQGRCHRLQGLYGDLYTQVLAQARMGKNLAETKAAVDLSKYQSWGQFKNWAHLNIEGAYERIQMNRRGN
ncbi:MAG: hypothetical protein VCF08_10305 [Alphaproteobacteria bacterium]